MRGRPNIDPATAPGLSVADPRPAADVDPILLPVTRQLAVRLARQRSLILLWAPLPLVFVGQAVTIQQCDPMDGRCRFHRPVRGDGGSDPP